MDAISSAAARPSSSPALNGLSSARIVFGAVALTFALLVLIASAGAERASACVSSAFSPLALSTFEAADGDQCDSDGVGPKRDWQTVAGSADLHTTIDAPSNNDTTYGSNNAGIVGGSTSELVPDSWNFTFGNIGGGKYDALSATSFTDPENNKLFLDLGFIRATTTGDTFLAFELNQRQPGYRLDPNEADATKPFSVPTRTSGDLLVTYHVGTAGAEELGLCVWDGNEHSGQWEEFAPDLSGDPITNQACPALSTSLYQAAINDGQSGRQGAISGAENYLDPGTPVSAGQFGEAVVNLTDALRDPDNPNGPQSCVDFGYVWLHSRSSDSLTSNQQDFILPANSISIGSCTVEGMKFNDLDGSGSRSVGEPYLGGWTIFVDYDNDGILDNNKDATFVNDMDGIVEAGEEEPYDVTADGTGTEPLGSYRITKVQPSNHSDPAGTWPVREILQSTWDCTAAVGAGAVLAPNVCPEDTSTNPDSALGFRLAWNDNQTYSGRDFGNRRQPAGLKVVKHVVNDNGGTATAAAWSLHVKSGATEVAGSPQPGDENGDTYSLTDGASYTVSETGGPSGYQATFSGDCNSSGAVTVTAGTLKTCTITNNDIAPVLTVVKHVVNDSGGTKTASDFSLTVDDPGTNPASFNGAEAPGTDVVIDPGAYAVSEGAHDGYAVSYSADCTSSLALGQTKTCTVTNNDIAPVLTVVKNVVNDSGGTKTASDFSITVDDPGTNPASFNGAEAPGTSVAVDPGAYTVSEGAHDGYAVSYSADCAGSLAIGQTKTCTVTNNDIAPVLTVVKHVVNDNGGTKAASDFSLTVDDPGTNPASFNGAEAPGTDVTVDPGAYTVSEGAHNGYAVSYSADCTSTLAIGETKTCTVTNDDIAPVLTVVKHVVNDNGGTKAASDFSLTVDDPGTNPASFNGAEAPGTDVTVDPGAYSVSEGAHAGYDVSYSAACTSTLAIGETKTCTVTNNDIAPGLTVVKHVVNDNGGTKTAADFLITVDDPGTNPASFNGAEAPGTNVTIDPGAYSVTEGSHTGYTATYSADCTGSLAIGQTATCTVTNNDIAPVLTVVKHVVNDDGGTKSAADFSLTVDDPGTNPASFAGAEAPGTDVVVDPGAYTVSEGAHAGYEVSYSAGCTSTLAIGETKTCTVTNNDIAPVLTIVKHVVNDDGGTKSAADFSLTVDDVGTNPASFAGAEAPGTNVVIDPGPYAVSEGAHDGYAVSYSADCTSTLAIGQTKTCTVTNNDIAPVLTVVKHVINGHGGTKAASDFSLTVDDPGTNPAPFAGAEAPGTDVTVDPGAYSVTEGAHVGYAVSYSADCTGTLAIGQTKTCTVTNNDIAPVLTVVKHVINGDGGTKAASDFSLTVDDPGTNPAPFAGAEAPGTDVVVDPGAYSVAEGAHAGYAVSYSADCAGTLAIGETKTCTVTNNDIAPGLTVVKHVVNDSGGTNTAADFSLTVDDPGTNPPSFAGSETGTEVAVDPGAYSVIEGPHTGYAVTYSADCTGTLALGETKTCTVTNNDIAPVLTVVKQVVNDDGGTKTASDFSLTVDDPGTNPAPFAGAEAPGTDVVVDPGAYAVAEGAHDGYAVSYSADCTSTLAIGQTKTCTVTNNDIAPVLTVVKHVVNDDGGTKTASDFSLTVDDPGTNAAAFPGAEAPGTDVTVDPGAYSVTEGAHDGYDVSYSDACTSTLAIGQKKTCTVTNDDIAPTLTVIKHMINGHGGTKTAADFSLTVDDPGTNPASFAGAEAPGTDVKVDPGAYSVTEGAHDGYVVSYSADCTGTLAIGEKKTCTVTNNDIAPVLTVVKHVVNDDGGTKTAADFSLTVDDPGTDPASFAGAEAPGTDVVVEAGAYSVSEGAHDGYAVSYSADCAGTLAIGQTKTCTVTNNDIAPVLTVVKHVVNDDGGTKSAADFSLTVDDPGSNPASFAGAEAPGTDVVVDPGAYSVSEGAHDGYAVTYSAACTSTLAIGQTKTCTVTNDDIAPVLTVIKHMINGHGGTKTASDFSLTVDDPGENPASFAGAEAPGTNVMVDPGAYSVTEGAHDGYVVSYSDDCTGTLAIGQTKTCTVTNNDIAPELTVVKHVVNKAGSTGQASDFTMHVTGNAITPAGFAGAEAPGVTTTLAAGPYEVSETGSATADYTQTKSADCSGTLAIGDKKTCTITNTRKTGTITVVKDLIPSTDDGRFDLRVDSTVVKQDAADGGTGSLEVVTGTHTVSEVAGSAGSLGNYAKAISCSNEQGAPGAGPMEVRVSDGAEITCTITNRRVLAQPVVVKAGDTFAYHGDSVSYTFAVSNTGNSPLHDVQVSDDRCPNVSAAPTSRQNDNGDELLDPAGVDETKPEVWIYTCSYPIGAHADGEANPVVNTATVTATDELDRPVTDTDQHATTLLHPAIALTKTGPATAIAGSRVIYLISAQNTGDVAFAAALVVVSDARCEAPPILLSTGTDASAGSFDPGDTWQYACAVQSAVGESVIHNVALVDGTDVNGRHATAQATADTILVAPQPRQAVAANVASGDPVLAPASAKLRGPTGCMPRTAKVRVTGKRIRQVTFTVDGRSKKIVRKADRAGRFSYSVSKAKMRTGTHRVRARVVYLAGSSARAKTLVMTLNKCRRAAVKPVFTG